MRRRQEDPEAGRDDPPLADHGRHKKKTIFKVGDVGRTLISVSRLQDAGHDVILSKRQPRIVNLKSGLITPLRRSGGMFILDMWMWVEDQNIEGHEKGTVKDVVMRDATKGSSGFTRRG